MATTRFGPFTISNGAFDTGIQAQANDELRTIAEGVVDFGGGVLGLLAPVLGPDGEDAPTPPDYPAPQLRKNSLICFVGSQAFQGGIDQAFRPRVSGTLVLSLNDPTPEDNSRGWTVFVERTTLDQPVASRPAGTFTVVSGPVSTGITVGTDDEVRTLSTGTVDFGGAVLGLGAPVLAADGEDAATPRDYPAPHLRKNSLICQVGRRLHQGGNDRTFSPSERGELILNLNDPTPQDNTRGWQVTIIVTAVTAPPLPASVLHGPFTVVGARVATGVVVEAGDEVRTAAEGSVDFGGSVLGIGAPVLTADGEDVPTPADYPAPQLRKNSLICQVGAGRFHQGGINRTFRAQSAGEVVLQPNDVSPADNSGGWRVTLEVTRPGVAVAPMSREPLRVVNMEVAQTIQRADTSVRLVAGKRTVVRAFLDAGVAPQPDVSGTLTILDAATGALRATVLPMRSPIVAPARGASDRANFEDSLNFEPPATALDGLTRLELQVSTGASMRTGTASRVAAFERRPAQPMQPILLSDQALMLPAPTMGDFASTMTAARKRWPTAESGFVLTPTPITGMISEDLTRRDGWDALLGRVAGMMLLAAPALRVALVPNNIDYSNNGIGRAPGVAGPPAFVGQRLLGATFAHELSHVYGVGHAACPPAGTAGAPDGIEPWLPAVIEDHGLDMDVPGLVLAGSNELMTYCGGSMRWPSIALWDVLFDHREVI